MSNYNEITNQAAVERVNGRTISFYPNLDIPKANAYGEGVQGKVKISIQDYTKGKGDNSIYANFNLELSDFYYLYERAKISNMPDALRRTKIIGWEKESSGKFAGLSATSKLVINRVGKTSDGQVRNYPWEITIQNGYAKAMPGKMAGTFYEGSGTFQVTKEATMKFTDVAFLEKMTQINNYIQMYKDIMVKPVFEKGLMEFIKSEEERKNRNSYSNNVEKEVKAEPKAEPAPAPTVTQSSTQEPKQMSMNDISSSQNAQVPKSTNSNCHKMTMVISSQFQHLDGNNAVAQCMIGGKTYAVMFHGVDEALMEAQEKQLAITCMLYADEKRQMHFDSMAD